MIWSSFFLPHKKVRGQKKKPSFNGDFYRKNVLKPLLKEVNRRTEDTDDLLTTDMFARNGSSNRMAPNPYCEGHHEDAPGEVPRHHRGLAPNSPDLNLIENLWAILTEKVYQVDPQNSVLL